MTEPSDTDDLDDLELFRTLAATNRRSVRNQLVERHMGLAAHIAKRYRRSGARDDDLRQVAMVGLVKAVDRFDPSTAQRSRRSPVEPSKASSNATSATGRGWYECRVEQRNSTWRSAAPPTS